MMCPGQGGAAPGPQFGHGCPSGHFCLGLAFGSQNGRPFGWHCKSQLGSEYVVLGSVQNLLAGVGLHLPQKMKGEPTPPQA